MRVTVLTGVICAATWIIIKMIFFYVSPVAYNIVPLVLLNMLFLLVAISVGLYLHKLRETEESNGLNDIKNGMTAGVPYALIVSVFLYFYYAKIDPEYNEHQIAEREYVLAQNLKDPVKFKKLKASNPDFEVKSKEEIYDEYMKSFESSYSPRSVTTLSLLGLILMSALNSIFVTIIFRKVVFREYNVKNNTVDE